MAGEADSYYNADQRGAPQQYGQQPPQYHQQQQYQYQQPPPPQQPYPPQNGYGAPVGQQNGGYQGQFDEKASFEQQFKIEKPKWNDLWAGILVCILAERRAASANDASSSSSALASSLSPASP